MPGRINVEDSGTGTVPLSSAVPENFGTLYERRALPTFIFEINYDIVSVAGSQGRTALWIISNYYK